MRPCRRSVRRGARLSAVRACHTFPRMELFCPGNSNNRNWYREARNMTEQEYWQRFAASGDIADYILYRGSAIAAEMRAKESAGYGTAGDNDGDRPAGSQDG